MAERPTSETVRGALLRKADRDDVTSLVSRVSELEATAAEQRAQIATLTARNDELRNEIVTFRQEAKDGIIVATRAANEARTAVSTALSAIAMAEPPASAASMAAVEADTARLKAELTDVRTTLAAKADINAVNEVLETKANKVTVAAALHKKVRARVTSAHAAPHGRTRPCCSHCICFYLPCSCPCPRFKKPSHPSRMSAAR